MTPPINIDGTQITGASIDGQDVSAITVDGTRVFSTVQNIVAPGNLVAWYPFEGNAKDETRTGGILDNAGIGVADSTDHSLNVSSGSPTFDSSDGVTDLKNGNNSGAFVFGGNDSFQENFGNASNDFTITLYFKPDSVGTDLVPLEYNVAAPSIEVNSNGIEAAYFDGSTAKRLTLDSNPSADVYVHVAFVNDAANNEVRAHLNGQAPLISANDVGSRSNQFDVGAFKSNGSFFDGSIDDVRFYDAALSGSDVTQIFQNTEP